MSNVIPFNKMRAINDANAVVIEAITGEPPKADDAHGALLEAAHAAQIIGEKMLDLSAALTLIAEKVKR